MNLFGNSKELQSGTSKLAKSQANLENEGEEYYKVKEVGWERLLSTSPLGESESLG